MKKNTHHFNFQDHNYGLKILIDPYYLEDTCLLLYNIKPGLPEG